MNSQNLSFTFKVHFKLGSAIDETFKERNIALPKGHPSFSLSTLTRWFNQFKRVLGDLKDHKGPSITETKEFGLFLKTIPYELIIILKPRQPAL